MRSAAFLSVVTQLCLVTSAVGVPSNPPVVNTSSGLFAPYIAESHPKVAAFLDIPYAQNPTGPLRFSPPVLAKPHSHGVVQATKLPLGCIQYLPSILQKTIITTAERAAAFQNGDNANTTEDCLRLSIFAPRTAVEPATAPMQRRVASKLPVVVWIHGGGYTIGGINTPYTLAPNWVERSQSHIVVHVQYRLNILGFPNAAGLAAGNVDTSKNQNLNLGLLDQRLAVEWVRDNIAQFGGDPKRITLWGESAGGCSTDGFLYAWASDPIVAGVISDSGNALTIESDIVDSTNHSSFARAASRLGCGNLSAANELACMRKVPAHKIKVYMQAFPGEAGAVDDDVSFVTIVDNMTIFHDYADRIAAGQFPAQIPMLIGTNSDEGAAVVPVDFPNNTTATEIPAEFAQLAQNFALNIHCNTIREVKLRAEAGAKTYQYLYAGNFSDISPLPWLGAYHTAELPMVFGTYGIVSPATEFEKRVSERMQDSYLEFARDPVNGLHRTSWPLATGSKGSAEVMEWAAQNVVAQLVDVDNLRDRCVQNGWSIY